MTNDTFNLMIANNPLVNKDVDTIKDAIDGFREMAMRFIHRELIGYWRKRGKAFTLASGTSTKSIKEEYTDLKEIRFLWTSTGEITVMPEKKYRRLYPNGVTSTGTPTGYVSIDNDDILFFPTPSTDTTINISYNYIPDFTDLETIPEDFQDMAVDFTLSYFENPEGNHFYWKKFLASMNTAKAQLKISEEEDIEIEAPEIIQTIGDTIEDLSRI
jgi:hypothetical protein